MAQLLVREIDPTVVERLKARAKNHGRSLEAELREILERASRTDMIKAHRLADRIRRKLSDREHTDSVELLAEDRRQ